MDKQTVKAVAKEFYKYLDNEKGAAHNTLRAYRSDIEDFVRFIEKSPADLIDHNTIRAYIVDVYKDLKKSSLARKVSAIKVFFKFMKKKGYIDENTSLIIRSPRIEKHLPKFYTIDEMFGYIRAYVFIRHACCRGSCHGPGRPSPRGHVGKGDG